MKAQGKRTARKLARHVVETKKADLPESTQPNWKGISRPVEKYLAALMKDTNQRTLASLDIDSAEILGKTDEAANEYAKERSAEMIGMKWEDGELVENPASEWAISQTTRDNLNRLASKATEEGWSVDELEKAILESEDFSEARAETIARTELSYAHNAACLASWEQSGVVTGKQWVLADTHPQDDECNLNADAGIIGLDESFPSGDDAPPLHPNCLCTVVAYAEE